MKALTLSLPQGKTRLIHHRPRTRFAARRIPIHISLAILGTSPPRALSQAGRMNG